MFAEKQSALVPVIVSKQEMANNEALDARFCQKHYTKQSTTVYCFGDLGCTTYRESAHGKRRVRKNWWNGELVNVEICQL